MDRAELALDCRNTHGEGVFWSHEQQRLYWTDIDGLLLWRFDPVSGSAESFEMPEKLCAYSLRTDGNLLAGFASGIALYDLHSGERRELHAFEPHLPHTQLNDGRCDRQGRFVVGGMNSKFDGSACSSVVQVDTDLTVRPLIEAVECANGTCFSPDGTRMYFTDSPTNEILAYDYNPQTGVLGPIVQRFSAQGQQGVPDGSTVDAEGYLWNARWGGQCVSRYAPDGTLDRVIKVPVHNPSCVAIGGPDLDTLFITTSRQGLSDAELEQLPLAGSLFAIKLDVKGLPEPLFAG